MTRLLSHRAGGKVNEVDSVYIDECVLHLVV